MLDRSFYQRPAPLLAPDLLGKLLVRQINGQRLAGIITEAEAYQGQTDLACHARVGLTKRTRVMFGQAGHAYVYFTYGMHWMLNIVADEDDLPAAVLVRAIYPLDGLELMEQNRPNLARLSNWLNGPAKLTRALDITGSLNGSDLCQEQSGIFIEDGLNFPSNLVRNSARIGLGKTPEPWLSMPWRWQVDWSDAEEIIKKEIGM